MKPHCSKNPLKRLESAILLLAILVLPGFGFRGCYSEEVKQGLEPIKLNYWRVWDGPDAFDEVIAAYNAVHPNIEIVYKKLRFEDYEKELVEAFAEDRGPDIFSIHNTWVDKYKTKIEPMPAAISLVYPTVQGTIKREIVPLLKTTKTPAIKDLEAQFVEVVVGDVVKKVPLPNSEKTEDRIFGLPLSVDTLALFYNRDLLNNAGIANPPRYWNREFQQNVKKLTRQDTKGQIIQSGVSLGGGANIERAPDILSALMIQNGTVMQSENGRVTFQDIPVALKNQGYNPGLEALRFYTDFANPAKEVYSWNKNLEPSLDLFVQGKLAMAFGYSYHLPAIRTRAPKLNLGIAAFPQIEPMSENQPIINYANYWVETVSKKTKYKDAAWDFIIFATKQEQVNSYLKAAKRPTALRSLIDAQKEDPEIGIFADQILTAKSWYQGKDPGAMETAMNEMIDMAVANGQSDLGGVLGLGAKKIQQTVEFNLSN